jgi:hypothetical protein
MTSLADQLCKLYEAVATPSWRWFESYLTYANARLPQALLEAYGLIKKNTYRNISVESLQFLIRKQIVDDLLIPIGNKHRTTKQGPTAMYDQQPLEPACMVDAATAAHRIIHDEQYLRIAHTSFNWFLGQNSVGMCIYNPETGGCYDGLSPQEVNLNQGAESTVCYLLARLQLERISRATT